MVNGNWLTSEKFFTTFPVTSIMRIEQFFISEEIVVDELNGFGNIETAFAFSSSAIAVVDELHPMLNGFEFKVTAFADVILSVAVILIKQLEEFTEAGTFH